jgi:hypothetical protein
MSSEWHLTNGRDRKRVLAEHLGPHPVVDDVDTLTDRDDGVDLKVTTAKVDRVPPAITRMLARYDYGIGRTFERHDGKWVIEVR